VKYKKHALDDITTIIITRSADEKILKIMRQIQARTGGIQTTDDAIREMLNNYKEKS